MRRSGHLIVPLALVCTLAFAGCASSPAAQAPTPTLAPTAAPTSVSPIVASPTATTEAAPPTATTEAAPATATTEAAPPTATTEAAPPTSTPTTAAIGAEILFLRDGQLIALDVASGDERALADEVRVFAATPDGRLLGLVRGQGASAELWLIGRDGSGLRRLTTNDRAESSLSWAPDGLSLAYTVAPDLPPPAPDWQGWGEWCADAEVRVIEVAGGVERTLGAGCEPAIGPDGRRIAFTTPPADSASGTSFPSANNAISIVNRQGANGWSIARSDGSGRLSGYLVHGPAWSPDSGRVAYQRFIGYQALTDINLTEVSSSFERKGEPVGFGAGWLLTPAYAPGGDLLAMVEHNFSDARGFTGYDIWAASVLRLDEEEELILPSDTLMLKGARLDSLPRATAVAWSPDGVSLAVILPAGWRPGLSDQEPAFAEEGPGELWRWRPGAPPDQRLAESIDFGSPLLWLPPLAT